MSDRRECPRCSTACDASPCRTTPNTKCGEIPCDACRDVRNTYPNVTCPECGHEFETDHELTPAPVVTCPVCCVALCGTEFETEVSVKWRLLV